MKGLVTPKRGAFALATLVALLVASAAGTSGAEATNSSTPAHAKLILRKSEIGKVIFDSNGNVVYMFGRDKTATSTCYGICAKAWPPLLTKSTPSVGTGLNANLLGTTKRKDGKLQVTYNGHALYYFRGAASSPADRKPGQLNGQGYITAFWVLNPRGRPIRHL